ncbi:putative RNA recognition motif domain, nucleotide-binding alpha-beta plait domain superfamily [Helianthus anomalus]
MKMLKLLFVMKMLKLFWLYLIIDKRLLNTDGNNMGDRRQGKEPKTQKDEGRVKYYITNLPEICGGNDMDGLLKVFGEISKIYIVRKRDKVGRRFGFVIFQHIRYKEELERSMKNLWMGSYKVRSNIARFTNVEDQKRDYNRRDFPISSEDKKDDGDRFLI